MAEYLKICCESTGEEDMEVMRNKKRKLLYSELENEDCVDVFPQNFVSPAESRASSCSLKSHDNDESYGGNGGVGGGGGVEKSLRSPDLKNFDLETKGFETENSTVSINGFSRETTPTSGLSSKDTSSTSKKKSPPQTTVPTRREMMPSAAELDELFAAAEKCEQKRFAEKYNYDIVKDVPLEGKYQWVRLHP